MSEVLKKDIHTLLHGDFPAEEIKGKRFHVTGATGLVGSLFVKTLLQGNRELGLDCTVVAVDLGTCGLDVRSLDDNS